MFVFVFVFDDVRVDSVRGVEQVHLCGVELVNVRPSASSAVTKRDVEVASHLHEMPHFPSRAIGKVSMY